MSENTRLKIAHVRVETRVLKTLACRNGILEFLKAKVDSVSMRFKNACVEKMF